MIRITTPILDDLSLPIAIHSTTNRKKLSIKSILDDGM